MSQNIFSLSLKTIGLLLTTVYFGVSFSAHAASQPEHKAPGKTDVTVPGEALYKPVSLAWFSRFHDQSLDRYIQQLLNNNNDIKSSESQIKVAEQTKRYMQTSHWVPIQTAISTQRDRYSQDSFQNGHPLKQHRFIFQPGLNSVFNLDYMNQYKNQLQLLDNTITINKLNRDAVTVDHLTLLAEAYFGLSESDRLLAIQDQLIANKQSQLEIYHCLLDINLATQQDILHTQQDLTLYQNTRNQLASQRQEFSSRIQNLISIRPDQHTMDSVTFPEFSSQATLHPNEVSSDDVLSRQDVLLKFFAIKNAKSNVDMQWKSAFPAIGINSNLGQRSFTWDKLFNANRFYSSFGLNMINPLTHYMDAKYQLKQAKFAYESSVNDFKSTILTALKETQDLLYTLDNSDTVGLKQAEAREAQLNQTYEATQSNMEQGLVPKIDLLKLSESKLSTQADKTQKQFVYLQHCLQLYKASGAHIS